MDVKKLLGQKTRDTPDLGRLLEGVREAIASTGEELGAADDAVLKQAERALSDLDAPDLARAAEADPGVRDALDRIREQGQARVDWLQRTAEARGDAVERSQRAVAVLLEAASRKAV